MINVAFLFLILTLAALAAEAGIRPSFSLDYSSWQATDIVIVTEGEVIDGNFTILETLKGDSVPFGQISIPELADFSGRSSRRVKERYSAKDLEPAKFVTGQKMILFLRHSNHTERKWETADFYKNFPTSVLWLEGSESFAFLQTINPGPSVLVEYGLKEIEIRKRVAEIYQIERSLNRVLKEEDTRKRAGLLETFAGSDFYLARHRAFEELKKCGVSALPVLRKMLADRSLLRLHHNIIESLALAGGPQVGDELVKIVKTEFEFWKALAPKLAKNWWNRIDNPNTETYRDHYGKVLAAIYQLQNLKYKKSGAVVNQFRRFWFSQPQLNDQSGLDHMIEECDKLLKLIG